MQSKVLMIRVDMGTHLAVVLDEAQANRIIDSFREGKCPEFIGGVQPDGTRWAVNTSKVSLMHTMSMEEMQQAQQAVAQQQQRPTYGSIPNPGKWSGI